MAKFQRVFSFVFRGSKVEELHRVIAPFLLPGVKRAQSLDVAWWPWESRSARGGRGGGKRKKKKEKGTVQGWSL